MRKLLARLTPWPVVAASPLVLVFVPPLGIASADPAAEIADVAFVSTIDDYGVAYSDKDAVIALGRTTCDAIDVGLTPAEVSTIAARNGFTPYEADVVVGAAIGSFCEEHMWMLDTPAGGTVIL